MNKTSQDDHKKLKCSKRLKLLEVLFLFSAPLLVPVPTV